MRNHNPDYVFGNMSLLKFRMAYDFLRADVVRVPDDIHIIIMGFSCKDVSSLNGKRKYNGNIIRDRGGTTGTTFDMLINFLDSPNAQHVQHLILENVETMLRGKKPSQNRNDIGNKLGARGFHCMFEDIINPSPTLPQSRPRWYSCWTKW